MAGMSRGQRAANSRLRNKKLQRLKEKIAKIPAEVRAEVRASLAKSGDAIVKTSKALAPVDDGDLRDSIRWQYGDEQRIAYSQGRGGEHELSIRISAGSDSVRYAHLVEFGTAAHPNKGTGEGTDHPGTAAQPFFYPAYRTHKKKAARATMAAMRRAIRKIAKAGASS